MSKAAKVPEFIVFAISRVPAWVYGDELVRYQLSELRTYHWISQPPIHVDHGELSGSQVLSHLYGSWKSTEEAEPSRFLFRSFAGRSQETDQRQMILDIQDGPRLLKPGTISLVDLKAGSRVHVAISSECRGIISHVRKFVTMGVVHSLDVVR